MKPSGEGRTGEGETFSLIISEHIPFTVDSVFHSWYTQYSNVLIHRRMGLKEKGLRIARKARELYGITGVLFPSHEGAVSFYRRAQEISHQIQLRAPDKHSAVPSAVYAAGLMSRIHHRVISAYLGEGDRHVFSRCLNRLSRSFPDTIPTLQSYTAQFPSGTAEPFQPEEALKDLLVTTVSMRNPALASSLDIFFDDSPLRQRTTYIPMINRYVDYLSTLDPVDESGKSLPEFLLEPAKLFPHDLSAQFEFIMKHWKDYIPDLAEAVLRVIDFIKEDFRVSFPPGPGPSEEPDYSSLEQEIERFSKDSNWMPRVIMLAKSTLVWLDQLSKKYGYHIYRLDQVPAREIDLMAERGFTVLWLIGLWERSSASKRIKHWCGNPEAEASAYSLRRYDIAESLGGWQALDVLRNQCSARGIRLASDMVPNHTGLDSDWMIHQPDLFLQSSYPPFPAYTYNSSSVCSEGNIDVCIEDHYYDKTDAAVTFKRIDRGTGDVRYIYHGNDGTSTPWNDTAQLDYLNPETRETVIRTIIHVARNFPVIRFDAAMTLAKRHIQRLWYPKPGHGGDIPGRSAFGMTDAEFHRAIPQEFWREVVDRVAAEAPDTLLLAEAFWMMEGYFVRTLGMHRVYNSAFMNMLKHEDNEKYRNTIKHTISFDPEILKRFVNFMNNPDEDTAVDQFGDGDKYFGVCTLLVTMPGLPMFGHGQIEGFREKYGMEYTRAYWDEQPDRYLVDEHYRRIFPLMKLRPLFAEARNFRMYDFITHHGVNDHVYVYTNRHEHHHALVIYNNCYERTAGWFHTSSPYLEKQEEGAEHCTQSLGEALMLKRSAKHYVIFTDPIDGLTYIRSSMEVHSRGMYAQLRGYETQVFLNFREAYDSQGLFHEIAGLLQGKGTQRFEHDLALMRLRPIHTWISPFIESDQIALMKNLLDGDESSIDMVKQRWLALFRGMLRSWNTEFKAEGSGLPAQLNESVLRKLLEYLDAVSAAFSSMKKPGTIPSKLQQFVQYSSSAMPEFSTVMLASVITVPLASSDRSGGTRRWTQALLLDVIFDQPLAEAGAAPEDVQRLLLGSEGMHHFSHWAEGITAGTSSASETLGSLFNDQLFRDLTRCNWHNGIQWFHKESFQEALVILGLSFLISETETDEQRHQQVFEVLYHWYTQEPHAQYQVDRLLELS